MRRLALVLCYDGTDFAGWQRQPTDRTVQAEVEEAMGRLLGGVAVTCVGASRTDAGVHARAQVAHLDLPADDAPTNLAWRLNAVMPSDLRVRGVADVDATFHARRSAQRKHYRYYFHVAPAACPFTDRYRWHVPARLDLDAMNDAGQVLVGRHDFAAFESTGSDRTDSVRDLWRCRVSGEPPDVVLDVEGSGFLRHMVRAIAGTLVRVGRRERPAAWVGEVLASRDRGTAGANAPASGLFLESVSYGDPHDGMLARAIQAAGELPPWRTHEERS